MRSLNQSPYTCPIEKSDSSISNAITVSLAATRSMSSFVQSLVLVSDFLGGIPGSGGGEGNNDLGVVLEAGAGVGLLSGVVFFWICLGTNII